MDERRVKQIKKSTTYRRWKTLYDDLMNTNSIGEQLDVIHTFIDRQSGFHHNWLSEYALTVIEVLVKHPEPEQIDLLV